MTRRIILLTVLLVLILACASASGESLFVDNRETDKIYPERLNLRDQPSKNGGIIGLYYTGAEVENLGQENEEFTKVCIGGVTGYMASEYLITAEEAAARYGKDSGFGTCRAAQVDLTGMWQTVVPLYTEADFRSDSAGEIENGALVSLIGVLGGQEDKARYEDTLRLYSYYTGVPVTLPGDQQPAETTAPAA